MWALDGKHAAGDYSLTAGLVGVMVSVVFWGSFMMFIKTKAVQKVNPDPLVIQARFTRGGAPLALFTCQSEREQCLMFETQSGIHEHEVRGAAPCLWGVDKVEGG